MAEEIHKCEGLCHDPTGWGHKWPCGRHAKHERDGHWYCGIHDPVRVKAREEKREVEYQKERGRQNRVWERRDLECTFCEGMTDKELKAGIAAKKKGAK